MASKSALTLALFLFLNLMLFSYTTEASRAHIYMIRNFNGRSILSTTNKCRQLQCCEHALNDDGSKGEGEGKYDANNCCMAINSLPDADAVECLCSTVGDIQGRVAKLCKREFSNYACPT